MGEHENSRLENCYVRLNNSKRKAMDRINAYEIECVAEKVVSARVEQTKCSQ